MGIPNLFLLGLAGLAVAIPFDPRPGEDKPSVRSSTETLKSHLTPRWASQTPGAIFEAKGLARMLRSQGLGDLVKNIDSEDIIPDKYQVHLKRTSKLSPWEHAKWATNLQKNSTTNPKGLEGVSPEAPSQSICRLSNSGIYWAGLGYATVDRLREDPSVASVNAISYLGNYTNMTLTPMEAFSPVNQYMVIMDPRSGMDVWTHAKNVTESWIKKNKDKDGGPFDGVTDFYDDGFKIYSGYFDPETAIQIADDDNVEWFFQAGASQGTLN
ncbi:unnamed protein product [Clonostachys byssicola]|uniref:Uncharacterized protein n=1 Tax=Clonostachys byssicola TaxID=160290 RepID=A0A9N9UD21_9HYPO|nr:unnamed protein product [Clonostachys byssicola]